MNTPYTHQDYPVHPASDHALVRCQARRRQLLGLLLIVVGSVWLWLRLIGWVGDLPSPIYWVEATLGMLERFNTGDVALSGPQAAYGMLGTYTIRSVR